MATPAFADDIRIEAGTAEQINHKGSVKRTRARGNKGFLARLAVRNNVQR